MPTISVFYGIVIKMYFADHQPPHIHVEYGDDEAVVALSGGRLIKGAVPPRVLRMVREWIPLHEAELAENWRLARAWQPLARVEPLP